LTRFGWVGCLTESGIVHQSVAEHVIATSCFHCATAWWYEADKGVSSWSKRVKPAVFTWKICWEQKYPANKKTRAPCPGFY